MISYISYFLFLVNDTAATDIYTLSLHDALPISRLQRRRCRGWHLHKNGRPSRSGRSCLSRRDRPPMWSVASCSTSSRRSEEHTSELQSQSNLVCRLLLEKKKRHTRVLFVAYTTT